MIRSMILVFILLSTRAPLAEAEVLKCVDDDGMVSYKDRPCSPDESSAEIDREYANELPLGMSAEARKVISAIARERESREAEHVRQRNEVIRKFTRQYEEKKALCRQYKEDYAALLRFKRRNGNLAGDYESAVIRRMRDACSS